MLRTTLLLAFLAAATMAFTCGEPEIDGRGTGGGGAGGHPADAGAHG